MSEKTYRMAITEAIKDLCLTVEGVISAEVDRSFAVNIDSAPMASCFVYAGPETRVTADNEATLGYETWDFVIVVEIWARKNDIEILLGRLHKVVAEDRYLQKIGGMRLLSGTGIKRDEANPQYFEVTEDKRAMVVSFTARYNHAIGNMFVPQ
jgi:hypothetical protein